MKKQLAIFVSLTFALTSCFISNAPTSKRSRQHFDAVNSIVASATTYGFGGGEVSKQCEISIGCTDYGFYEYISPNINADGKFTVEQMCQKFLEFGEAQKFKFWRRDMHESEEVDVKSIETGLTACIDAMETASAPADGGSEGFVLHGVKTGFGKPIGFSLQLNSYVNEGKNHEYSLIVFANEEVWPVPPNEQSS